MKYALITLFIVCCAFPLSGFPDYDWRPIYYIAGQAFLHGQSPYIGTSFVNPIWSMLVVAPLSVFGADYSRGLIGALTLLASAWLCWKFKMSVVGTLLFILSGTVFGNFRAGNLDALVLLGLFLPSQWRLLTLMTKPQIGLGYAVWEALNSWQAKTLIQTFAPLMIGICINLIVFPSWLATISMPSTMYWNRSLFPYSVPLGLYVLWMAVRKDKPAWALAASAFLSPYLSLYSYVTVQVAFMDPSAKHRDWWMLAFFLISWTVQLLFGR